MADQSAIEWTDSTFNPWIGCTKVGPGCDHCYAEQQDKFRSWTPAGWGAGMPRKRTSAHNWRGPVAWNAKHAEFFAAHGRRQRVFCASLADVFDNEVPQEWRDDLFRLIEATPNLDWLLLTKRIGNVRHQVWPRWMQAGFPANVWLGATMVNQEELDRDYCKLVSVPASVRFISVEPMIGPISIVNWPLFDEQERPMLHWVIVGGESGPGARPMQAAWAKDLRDECEAARIAFLFKQWGEWLGEHQDGAPDRPTIELNATDGPVRVGKKAAGRSLDGRTHDGFPNGVPPSPARSNLRPDDSYPDRATLEQEPWREELNCKGSPGECAHNGACMYACGVMEVPKNG